MHKLILAVSIIMSCILLTGCDSNLTLGVYSNFTKAKILLPDGIIESYDIDSWSYVHDENVIQVVVKGKSNKRKVIMTHSSRIILEGPVQDQLF